MIKNEMDNNWVYAAIKRAYVIGWRHHEESKAPWDAKVVADVLSMFWPTKTSFEYQCGVEAQLAENPLPIVERASNVTLIIDAYNAGIEGSTSFDDCKTHGAHDMSFQTWIELMENDKSHQQYVEAKAEEYANKKYSSPEREDFNHQAINIRRFTGSDQSIGTYYGNLQKGDVVRFGLTYFRVSEVSGNSAIAKELGHVEAAKVSSHHYVTGLSGLRKSDPEEANCEKGFLVEGGSPSDEDILVKEGIVPKFTDALADALAKAKRSKRSKKHGKSANAGAKRVSK